MVSYVGAGGMGVVYQAEQVALHRKVALKVLRAEMISQSDMSERFRREAQLLSSVEHAAVVRVIDFGFEQGLAVLVLDYVEGDALSLAMREGPMAPARAVPLLVQLAQGLAAIHAKGIVHRDLKPDNVMLTKTLDGEVARLLDFGIARLATPDAPGVTQMGMAIGTPEYLSPEQALGQPPLPSSDIYSFGVVAYQMLSGRLPLPGKSSAELINQHITHPPQPLLEAAPMMSEFPALAALVMQCLEKNAAARPQSAAVLVDQLLVSGGGPIPLVQLANSGSWGRVLTGPVAVQKPPKSKKPMFIGGAVAVAVIAAAVAATVLYLAPERKARRLIEHNDGTLALQVIDDSGEKAQQPQMKMLRAAALHQVNRHDEEFELFSGISPAPETQLEPLVIRGLADDFGRRDAAPIRKALTAWPKATLLPILQDLANEPPDKAQWGALRLVDLEYAGQGLKLVDLYIRALDSSDCRVRWAAANRLGELRAPEAVEPLKHLRDLPKKSKNDDCGQDAAAAALKRLEKELTP
ncbi:MAG: protein kinase [Myxococcaceae bacterium]